MPLRADTYEIQSKLAEFTRDGKEPQLEGITPDRLHHYRRLIFNIVDNSMKTAYPLTRKLLSKDEWHELVDYFFRTQKSQEHQVWRMPVMLYEYVRDNDLAIKKKYPFLIDLLHFEWIEIEVYTMEDSEPFAVKEDGDWLNDLIAIHPDFSMQIYNWPVHTKKPSEITAEDEGKHFMLCYRHPETLSVRYQDLSGFHAFLIEQLAKGEYRLNDILDAATELFETPREDLEPNAVKFLEKMKEKRFVLGFLTRRSY